VKNGKFNDVTPCSLVPLKGCEDLKGCDRDADGCQNLRAHPYRNMTGKHLVTAKSGFNEIIERAHEGGSNRKTMELHSDELHNLYCTRNIIKVIKIRNENVATMRGEICKHAFGGEV